jgi:hypothetical protein
MYVGSRVARFLWYNIPKGGNIPNNYKIYLPIEGNIPNDYKIYQITTKYTK